MSDSRKSLAKLTGYEGTGRFFRQLRQAGRLAERRRKQRPCLRARAALTVTGPRAMFSPSTGKSWNHDEESANNTADFRRRRSRHLVTARRLAEPE
jgi:hypothetical protein